MHNFPGTTQSMLLAENGQAPDNEGRQTVRREVFSSPLARPSAFALGLAVLTLAALAGCGSVGVQPWERDLLAQEAMATGGNPVDAAMDAHIYFSKEASTGGSGVGGGGCGCN
jgi:hypothetical protein